MKMSQSWIDLANESFGSGRVKFGSLKFCSGSSSVRVKFRLIEFGFGLVAVRIEYGLG